MIQESSCIRQRGHQDAYQAACVWGVRAKGSMVCIMLNARAYCCQNET